jgi:ribonuclease VapC
VIFVDASALVAIIAGEPEADDLADILERFETRFCSAISVWETVAALRKNYKLTSAAARGEVDFYVTDLRLACVPIGAAEAGLAVAAYEKYGKGRHKAALNMGDCFAYACAKANGAKLLFKGDDFGLTDIDIA